MGSSGVFYDRETDDDGRDHPPQVVEVEAAGGNVGVGVVIVARRALFRLLGDAVVGVGLVALGECVHSLFVLVLAADLLDGDRVEEGVAADESILVIRVIASEPEAEGDIRHVVGGRDDHEGVGAPCAVGVDVLEAHALVAAVGGAEIELDVRAAVVRRRPGVVVADVPDAVGEHAHGDPVCGLGPKR